MRAEEQDHLRGPITWQLFMMIRLFLYLEAHQNPGLWVICIHLTLKLCVNSLSFLYLLKYWIMWPNISSHYGWEFDVYLWRADGLFPQMVWSRIKKRGYHPSPRGGSCGVLCGTKWYIVGGGSRKKRMPHNWKTYLNIFTCFCNVELLHMICMIVMLP